MPCLITTLLYYIIDIDDLLRLYWLKIERLAVWDVGIIVSQGL
jgi:hypothetical protein